MVSKQIRLNISLIHLFFLNKWKKSFKKTSFSIFCSLVIQSFMLKYFMKIFLLFVNFFYFFRQKNSIIEE